MVVDVHRLDADPARAGHLGEVHAVAPSRPVLTSCCTASIVHRRVLVEEAARLDQDLLAGAERALEHVAVAVQQQQARLPLG